MLLLNLFDARRKDFGGTFKVFANDSTLYSLDEVAVARNEVHTFYGKKLEEESAKLASVTSEMKEQEVLERYKRIKHDVLANCKVMLDPTTDDEDFLNRLAEVQKLRNQLYKPESRLECVIKIRKQNGTVKYNIRQLKIERDKVLSEISEEVVKDFNKCLEL